MSDLFPETLPRVTRAQIIKELEREAALRKTVYERWVRAGRLKRATMEHRIACIKAAIAILAEIDDGD